MIPSQNLSIAISRFSMFSIQIFLDAERKRERTFSKRFLFPSKMLIKKRNEPRVTFVWSVVLVTLGRSLSANTSVLFNFPIRIPGFSGSGRVSFVADKFNSRPRIWSSPGLHPDFHPDIHIFVLWLIIVPWISIIIRELICPSWYLVFFPSLLSSFGNFHSHLSDFPPHF